MTARRVPTSVTVVFVALLSACGGGRSGGGPPQIVPSVGPSLSPSIPPSIPVLQLSSDPFTNMTSEHATEVEPSAFTLGNAVVIAFQMGRFQVHGASDLGFAASFDGGTTWSTAPLGSETTFSQPPGVADSISDPVVAYDAAHSVWLIAGIPVSLSGTRMFGIYVSRSIDALHWSAPVELPQTPALEDKPWIACDDSSASPFFGRCYVEWDDGGTNGLIHVSFSNDAGVTWSAPQQTASNGMGIGGQLLIRADGTIVMPIDDFNEQSVLSTVSHDGGATWSATTLVSPIVLHGERGLRAGPLNSAGMDAAGTVYVVWFDCRFRPGCSQNDMVMSTSADGIGWSAPARIPIDPISSTIDHFIAGFAVDRNTAGAGAHLALTYYFYPQAACTPATCQLYAGFIASSNGGATWSSPATLAGPMSLSWLAQTTQGSMVGDYVASFFSSGRARAVFASASAPAGSTLNEAIFVSK